MLSQKAVWMLFEDCGWSGKHLTVAALNVSVLSLSLRGGSSSPTVIFGDGLLIGCLFRAVSSVLAQICDQPEEARQAVSVPKV